MKGFGPGKGGKGRGRMIQPNLAGQAGFSKPRQFMTPPPPVAGVAGKSRVYPTANGGADEVGPVASLVVSGCSHEAVGRIFRGDFNRSGINHGKPVYKKTQKVDGHEVLIYFWDSRDGASVSGWWVGSKVGGDQVWAFNPKTNAQTPPCRGWRVPFEGPVDNSLVLSAAGTAPVAKVTAQVKVQTEVGKDSNLFIVAGCKHPVVGPITNGNYAVNGENHGKPVYKKSQQFNNSDVLIYFWNDPKNRSFSGWWFGPKVGGDQVWAFNPNCEVTTAPSKGWKVPYDGPVDESFNLLPDRKSVAEKQKAEKDAANKIRLVVAKLNASKSETFDAIQKEMQDILKSELEKTGSLKASLKEECDKALEAAKNKFEDIKKAKASAEPLLKELAALITEAEEAISDWKAKALDEGARSTADEKVKQCTEFINEKGTALRAGGVQNGSQSSELNFVDLLQKVNVCKKSLKQADAKAKFEVLTAKFSTYDKNKDGFLDKAECKNFAKGECGFALTDSAVDIILKALVTGAAKGVKKDDLHRLKVHVGIARERTIDAARRKRREARDEELAEMKKNLLAKVEEISKIVTEVSEAVKKVEEEAKVLKTESKSQNSSDVKSRVDDLEEKSKSALATVEASKKALADLKEGLAPELIGWLKGQTRSWHSKLVGFERQLKGLNSLSGKVRGVADKKASLEVLVLEKKALEILKAEQAKGVSNDDIFQAVSSSKDEIDKDSFVAYFSKHTPEGDESPISADDLERVFIHWDDEQDGSIGKERFMALVRHFMKVIKGTSITDEVSIKSCNGLRKLELGEVVEILGVPVSEDEAGVKRVRVKAMKDELEGWATISGNQGSVYLQDGGGVFKVVKETIMTEAFELDADVKESSLKLKDTTRKLKVGELVEVRTWPRKDEKTGLVRMRCKAKSDGALGWVTSVGNAGTVFLEVK